MKTIVISPENLDAREIGVLGALLASGLERYHVRKPTWPAAWLEDWLKTVPVDWRPRLILHQHHHFVETYGLGGRHWRDMPGNAGGSTPGWPLVPKPGRPLTSRSCHDVTALRTCLDRYDSIFFGPLFPSLSKPGYGPSGDFSPQDLSALLAQRTKAERRAAVLALGGITEDTAARAMALGFDGVAVLGAVWQAPDPVKAFELIRDVVSGAKRAPSNQAQSDDAA